MAGCPMNLAVPRGPGPQALPRDTDSTEQSTRAGEHPGATSSPGISEPHMCVYRQGGNVLAVCCWFWIQLCTF